MTYKITPTDYDLEELDRNPFDYSIPGNMGEASDYWNEYIYELLADFYDEYKDYDFRDQSELDRVLSNFCKKWVNGLSNNDKIDFVVNFLKDGNDFAESFSELCEYKSLSGLILSFAKDDIKLIKTTR